MDSSALDRIRIVQANMLEADVDAIVNAANEQLRHGGGVAAAISRAAGWRLTVESKQLIEERGLVPTGSAVATSAGDLPQRYVIHTPGPIWHGGDAEEPALLASSHRSVIELGVELQVRSIAFPAISCGIFGYPVRQAAPIALGATEHALRFAPSIHEVRFCLIEEHFPVFQAAYAQLADELSR